MNLFKFTETAEDSDLHNWYRYANTGEFALVSGSDIKSRPVLFKSDEGIEHNNCTFDEARMYFAFVALSCQLETVYREG